MDNIEAEAVGGEYHVKISSNREWVAKANAPWVLVSPANGRGDVKCTIKIDSALMNEARETKVSITSMGEELKSIDIRQEGFPRSIKVADSEVRIAASDAYANRWVELDVETNVEFEIIDAPAWVIVKKEYELNLDRGARPRKTRIHFDWKMNSSSSERVATLNLVPKEGAALATPATITVRQAAGPRIEDNRKGDSLAVITICEKMECWSDNGISTTNGMQTWECLRLWQASDAALPAPEAVGRVRDLDISYFDTNEGVPEEIKHLKYLETLSLYGNVNTMIKSIDLCPEVATLAYLKDLRLAAMGIVSLPHNFADLGDTLESLDLNSNNLNEIPEVISKENFPHLKSLNLSSNHRASITDLRKRSTAGDNGIGMYVNMRENNAVRKLLLWDELEELGLSYNFIEGELPDFVVGEDITFNIQQNEGREREAIVTIKYKTLSFDVTIKQEAAYDGYKLSYSAGTYYAPGTPMNDTDAHNYYAVFSTSEDLSGYYLPDSSYLELDFWAETGDAENPTIPYGEYIVDINNSCEPGTIGCSYSRFIYFDADYMPVVWILPVEGKVVVSEDKIEGYFIDSYGDKATFRYKGTLAVALDDGEVY